MERASVPETPDYQQYRADIMTRVLEGKASWEAMLQELDEKAKKGELTPIQEVEILQSLIRNMN